MDPEETKWMTPLDANLAVVITADRDYGGAYQYTRTVIRALEESDISAQYFYFDGDWAESDLHRGAWQRIPRLEQAIRYATSQVFEHLGVDPTRLGPARRLLSPTLLGYDPDLCIYPTPSPMAFEVDQPYLMAIHDLQHKINPQFPEVSKGGEFRHREYLFRHGSEDAAGVLTDSETGREDVLRFYDIDPERVHVLPFVAPDYLQESENVIDQDLLAELPDRYLFYPAQYWKHKNHVTLLEAVARLRNDGIETPLVLVGGEKNAAEEVQATVMSHDLTDLVTQLGYVENDAMYTLYKGARALVMPTYFGPTNIPILEAFTLGCPVITSNVHGIPEQVGDAGLLVNPDSVSELATAIREVWTDPDLCRKLVDRGRQRVESYTPGDFRQRLLDAIDRSLRAADA